MIRISDNWSDYAVKMQANYVESKIAAALDGDYPIDPLASTFITQNRVAIQSGEPFKLRRVIDAAEALREATSKVIFEKFIDDCKMVFDYDAFSRRALPNWGAYALCAESKYAMCPYCHQAFAHTVVRDENGGFRPTLDHFYKKATYPYLGLSVYNLVPSCYTCNSQLKGAADFYINGHIHPLESGDDSIEFTFDLRSYIAQRVLGDRNIEFGIRASSAEGVSSIATFALDRRFEVNSHYLNAFVARVMAYESHHDARAVLSARVDFELTENDIIGFDVENYRNEMLGKIKLDLYASLMLR